MLISKGADVNVKLRSGSMINDDEHYGSFEETDFSSLADLDY